jgi:5-methyltetrahydropteroyltriglutamate--homocysteine methyltransferase
MNHDREEETMKVDDGITTAMVGSYTVPDWYPALQRAVEAGELPPAAFADAKAVAARAAVKDPEAARLGVVGDGELFRRDDNRFGPPNAMINHFAAKIPGFSGELRAKSGITPVAPDAALPAPVVVDELQPAPLGLTEELAFLRATTEKPVKIALTGPHMFARVAWDEHYDSREALAFAMAEVVNAELRRLDDAGCDLIQLDEPVVWFLADDREWAVEAINRSFAGVTHGLRVLHMCQGNYNSDPDAHLGLRIFPAEFDAVRPVLEEAEVDVVHLAFASLGVDDLSALRDFPRDKALAVGAVDVQSHRIETPDEVAATLERVVSTLDGSPVVAAPDCGLCHLPRNVAFAKLRALARGAALVSGAASAREASLA